MAASDAKYFALKNTALRVTFPIYDNTGALVSGAAGLDSEVSIDGGTFTDCTNEATEIATASGIYYLDLVAGEVNGDTIAILVKTSTVDAKTTALVIYPVSTANAVLGVNVAAMAANTVTASALATDAVTEIQSGLATASALSTVDTVVDAIQAKTDNLPADPAATSDIPTAVQNADTFLNRNIDHPPLLPPDGVDVVEQAPPSQKARRLRYPLIVSTGELAPPIHGASIDRVPALVSGGLPMPRGKRGDLNPDTT